MGGPSRINPVSVAVVLLVAGAIYLGWKFIPVYWQAQKVENLLDGYKQEASEIRLHERDSREEQILDRIRNDVIELGIDDPRLLVQFGPDYKTLSVSYKVEIRFIFGKSKTLEFNPTVDVPRDDF